jgi:hypothetical protein
MQIVSARILERSVPRRLAHYVTDSDNRFYYVKPNSAPGCTAKKTLGAKIAGFCGVRAVEPVQIIFDDDFVRRARAQCGAGEVCTSITAGVHFGSRHPANPNVQAAYEMLPEKFDGMVRNIQDFSVMRAVDVWIANSVAGMTIFVRQPERDFVAFMSGFGQCFSFSGPEEFRNWCWRLAPLYSPYTWKIAFETLGVIRRIGRAELETMMSDIPADWWKGFATPPSELIDQLLSRQDRLEELLVKSRQFDLQLLVRGKRKMVHVETALGPYATIKSA